MSVTFSGKPRNIAIALAIIMLCVAYGCNDNAESSHDASRDTAQPPVSTDSSSGVSATPDTTSAKSVDSVKGIGVVNPRPNVNR